MPLCFHIAILHPYPALNNRLLTARSGLRCTALPSSLLPTPRCSIASTAIFRKHAVVAPADETAGITPTVG